MVARPVFTNLFSVLYRDYNTAGNPGSGVYHPEKSLIRGRGAQEEALWNQVYDKLSHVVGGLGGSANAATGTLTPTLDARATGGSYWYTPAATNTAAGPTLAIDGVFTATLADADGVDLPVGGVIAGRTYKLLDDGTKLRVIAQRDTTLYKELDVDDAAGLNATTAQPWFATAGGVTLPVGSWFGEAVIWLARTAGVVSHTTNFLFAGTATYTIDWDAIVNTGDTAGMAAANLVAAAVATATQVKAASTSATEQLVARVTFRLRVSVGGSFIPQFSYSVAPGGTPNAKRGSFIRLTPRPGGLAVVGPWA